MAAQDTQGHILGGGDAVGAERVVEPVAQAPFEPGGEVSDAALLRNTRNSSEHERSSLSLAVVAATAAIGVLAAVPAA